MAEENPQDNFFDTEHLKADLKGRSVRGGAVTMAAQGAQFFLHLGSTVVLARLLTPQDYGLIGMVTAVTGFVAMFKDLGLSMATVQKSEINHGQISTLFWINVLLSFGVMLVTAALAPAIAWFYGEPRLTWITLALASAFIFGGLTVQHQALLRRNMRFGALAFIQIASMLAGIITAIIAAWCGLRYWALVLMQVAAAITNAIAVWVACPWCPGLPVRRSDVRKMLAFGGHLTGFSFLNYFARNLDNVLIGKVWGAQPLGFYSKAYGLLMFPLAQINTPVSAVAIPALSRLQDEEERYRNYYLKAISLIAFVTMPLVMFLIVMSSEVIHVLLGPQWSPVSRIFVFLGISALGQPIANTAGWLYISQGRTRDMFTWGMIGSSIIVAAIVAGLPWGAVGVAASYTIFNVAAVPLFYWFLCRKGPIRAHHIFKAVVPFLWASLWVLGALLVLRATGHSPNPALELAAGFVLTVLVVPIALVFFPGGKKHLSDSVSLASVLLKGRVVSSSR